MNERGDDFKWLDDSFKNMDGRIHVLEYQVPFDRQLEYFEFSNEVRKSIPDIQNIDYEKYMEELKSNISTKEDKKKSLSILATSKQVKIYRFLESYARETDDELSNWACMALMESRIILESELLGEKQILISTGLGGKGDKFRFYVLIISSLQEPFADYQKKIIGDELTFVLSQNDCVCERIRIEDKYVEIVLLMPVMVNLKNILHSVITECNQYGNFLRKICTITNVKELDEEEVAGIMGKYEIKTG